MKQEVPQPRHSPRESPPFLDRYCTDLTINDTYDKHGPLGGPNRRDRLSLD